MRPADEDAAAAAAARQFADVLVGPTLQAEDHRLVQRAHVEHTHRRLLRRRLKQSGRARARVHWLVPYHSQTATLEKLLRVCKVLPGFMEFY